MLPFRRPCHAQLCEQIDSVKHGAWLPGDAARGRGRASHLALAMRLRCPQQPGMRRLHGRPVLQGPGSGHARARAGKHDQPAGAVAERAAVHRRDGRRSSRASPPALLHCACNLRLRQRGGSGCWLLAAWWDVTSMPSQPPPHVQGRCLPPGVATRLSRACRPCLCTATS